MVTLTLVPIYLINYDFAGGHFSHSHNFFCVCWVSISPLAILHCVSLSLSRCFYFSFTCLSSFCLSASFSFSIYYFWASSTIGNRSLSLSRSGSHFLLSNVEKISVVGAQPPPPSLLCSVTSFAVPRRVRSARNHQLHWDECLSF